MNISQEAREAAKVLNDYLAIRGFKDGQAEVAMQTLIDQTIERCALAVHSAWRDAPNTADSRYQQNLVGPGCAFALEAIRALKSNPTDGGKDER